MVINKLLVTGGYGMIEEYIDRLSKMVKAYRCADSNKQVLNKYKWYSLASGIRNDELTRELLKEILQDARGNI